MPSTNKLKPPTITLTKLLLIYSGLLAVWAAYRYFVHTSIWIEEIIIKGIIFSLPLFLFPLPGKNKLETIGISRKNFFSSVYMGILIGLLLGFAGEIGNFLRHNTLLFSAFGLDTSGKLGAFLILSLITGFWEQLLFSGYFLEQIQLIVKDEANAAVITSLLFSVIHLPAYLFVQRMNLPQTLLSLCLLFTLGIGCSIIKFRQKNLIAPLMTHALWGVTVFLFR